MSKMSSLEHVVYDILVRENFHFEQEKCFRDYYNGKYRFDFYLPYERVIIEVHGAQHYEYTKSFYQKESDFKKAQERDRRKISYCLARNIKIYCIPYWEIKNLHTYADLVQEKFHATSKFHNDKIYRQQKLGKQDQQNHFNYGRS